MYFICSVEFTPCSCMYPLISTYLELITYQPSANIRPIIHIAIINILSFFVVFAFFKTSNIEISTIGKYTYLASDTNIVLIPNIILFFIVSCSFCLICYVKYYC